MRLLRDRLSRTSFHPLAGAGAALLVGALVGGLGLPACVDASTEQAPPTDGDPDGDPSDTSAPGMIAATELGVAALDVPPIEHTLTVATAGDGGGTVVSADERIACGPSCQAKVYDGEYVTLHATPAVGATFRGWFGEGCLQATPCTVTVRRAMTLTAYFTVDDPTSVPGQP